MAQMDALLSQYVEEVWNPSFPYARRSVNWSILRNGIDVKDYGINIFLDDFSTLYRDSIFDYKENNNLIHYTSLSTLFSILNSGTIRLSDFNYLADPLELKTAFKGMGLLDDEMEQRLEVAKSFYFTFCTSEYCGSDSEDFGMWRLYGDNGYGVGIVFEVDHQKKYEWMDYSLNRICYDYSGKRELQAIIDRHADFQEKMKEHLWIKNLLENLFHIAALQKEEIYNVEREVRLLFRSNYVYQNNRKAISTYPGVKYFYHNGFRRSYLELPIGKRRDDESSTLVKTPRIMIKKIVLGYRYKEELEPMDTIKLACLFNKMPEIEVVRSRFATNFE